jgi:hypothetical protein
MESDADVPRYMIHHVFLPPQLPQESESNSFRMDHQLLLEVEKTSRQFIKLIHMSEESAIIGTTAKWERINKMLQNMSTLHEGPFLVKQELVSAFKKMDTKGQWLSSNPTSASH